MRFWKLPKDAWRSQLNVAKNHDDHQLDIAGEMEKEGRITVVHDVGELEGVLDNVSTASEIKVVTEGKLVRVLERYLEGMICD